MENILAEERKQSLRELARALGVEFHNLNFLQQALTHTSYAN